MDAEILRACEQLSIGVGGALAAKPLLEKLLGPSFEYVGTAMADLLGRYGNRNVQDIFRLTAAKVQDKHFGQSVNPRVLRTIIEEGSFIHDDVTKEYFAGLLASSFTGDVSDDQAITFLAIVKSLTASQVQIHHLFYSLKRLRFLNDAMQALSSAGTDVIGPLLIPNDLLASQTGITESAPSHQAVRGLAYHGLIGDAYEINAHYFVPAIQSGVRGTVMAGSDMGAELFLWVHGCRNNIAADLCRSDIRLISWEPIQPLPGAVLNALTISKQREAKQLVRKALDACVSGGRGGYAAEAEIVGILKQLRGTVMSVLPRQTQSWLMDTATTLPKSADIVHEKLDQCRELLEGR